MAANDRGQREMDAATEDMTPAAKRCRRQEAANAQLIVPASEDMQVDSACINTLQAAAQQHTGAAVVAPILSADDVLTQMVLSGGCSHDQVVQFCVSSGIPLSRMLRLDLMRLNRSQQSNP